MSTAAEPRRFIPESIETSSRSSAKRHDHRETVSAHSLSTDLDSRPAPDTSEDSKSAASARRKLPQAVEESTRSARKFHPEPVETTTRHRRKHDPSDAVEDPGQDSTAPPASSHSPSSPKSPRRFAPEPVETTTRSSRRFAPEPVETSRVTRRKQNGKENAEVSTSTKSGKFLPEPTEVTTSRRHRRKAEDEEEQDPEASRPRPAELDLLTASTSNSKKYSPELLETARGSYKQGQHTRSLPPIPENQRSSPLQSGSPPEPAPDIHESRFSAAALAKRLHPERQHSYIAPDLPVIESDPSEEELDVPSLSVTPSASSDDTVDHRGVPIRGKFVQDKATNHKFSPSEQDKLLREQAMAAYINENIHEPVDHFAFDREDDDAPLPKGKLSGDNGIDVRTFRRDSAVDLDWHMREMREHHSELAKMKKDLKADTPGGSRFSAAALASRQARGNKLTANQRGVGITEMRSAASPPMLGDDLVFPRSVSPKMTRLTPDQVPVARKHADAAKADIGEGPQLWSTNIGASCSPSGGLWMGFCHKADDDAFSAPPAPIRSGIMTPAVESEDPISTQTPGKSHGRFGHGLGFLPLTPPRPGQDAFTDSLDRRLNAEQEIEKEFHNGMITQIYNYVSLGYPSLAHKFDSELSKISRIPIEELRKDDLHADAKGYVGAPEGDGIDEESMAEGKCARWTALRLYVKEWARQLPHMGDKEREDWGVRGRRGSWAI